MGQLPALMSAAGSVASAAGTIAAGNARDASAQYQAALDEQQAAEARAAAQRQAMQLREQTGLAQSEAQAKAAASGFGAGATDPSVVTDAARLQGEGELQAETAQAAGDARAQELNAQAVVLRMTGGAARTAALSGAAGTIAGDAANWLDKYGQGGPPTAADRDNDQRAAGSAPVAPDPASRGMLAQIQAAFHPALTPPPPQRAPDLPGAVAADVGPANAGTAVTTRGLAVLPAGEQTATATPAAAANAGPPADAVPGAVAAPPPMMTGPIPPEDTPQGVRRGLPATLAGNLASPANLGLMGDSNALVQSLRSEGAGGAFAGYGSLGAGQNDRPVQLAQDLNLPGIGWDYIWKDVGRARDAVTGLSQTAEDAAGAAAKAAVNATVPLRQDAATEVIRFGSWLHHTPPPARLEDIPGDDYKVEINGQTKRFGPDQPGWHNYLVGPALLCTAEEHCTIEQVADYMSRFAYPFQDRSKPIEDDPDGKKGAFIDVGVAANDLVALGGYPTQWRIGTKVEEQGLKTTNIALENHAFYPGVVVRRAYQDDKGAWYVTTHGFGNNVFRGMDTFNQFQGPAAFDTVNTQMRDYAKAQKGTQ